MSSLKTLICAFPLLGGALLLHGCSGGAIGGPGGPLLGSSEKIVFVRPHNGASEPRGSGPIWIVDADGKNARALTTGDDSQPTVLLNTIAFVRGTTLWTMNIDGTEQKKVPTDGDFSFRAITDPAWKPDGRSITFSGQETRATLAHLYTIDLKTNAITKITGVTDNPDTSINAPGTPTTSGEREYTLAQSDEYDPEWSSDGQQLVFATDRHYRLNLGQATKKNISELYKLTFTGASGKLTRLTNHLSGGAFSPMPTFNGSTGNPTFSDDGATIAFESADLDNHAHVFTIPATGVAVTADKWHEVYSEGGSDTAPTYEPENHNLAFAVDGKILSLSDTSKTAAPITITQGVQPSWGKSLVVTTPTSGPTTSPTTGPTTGPTAAPTTRPTTSPTTRPTTSPTTRPTATPTATPGGGTTIFTDDLYPQDYVTLVRKADNSVARSTVFGIAGDREAAGDQTEQSIGQFPIGPIPTGQTVVSATVQLNQTASTLQGNPYANLGAFYIERATSLSLNEGALDQTSVLVGSKQFAQQTVDITSLLKKAVSAHEDTLYVRLRFQRPVNYDGKNDSIVTNIAPIHVTYSQAK